LKFLKKKKALGGHCKTQNNNNMENLVKLDRLNDIAQSEGLKFAEGNKSAGTRLRKTLLEIKTLSHEIRKEVSETKNK
jgi:hypothetical protein